MKFNFKDKHVYLCLHHNNKMRDCYLLRGLNPVGADGGSDALALSEFGDVIVPSLLA